MARPARKLACSLGTSLLLCAGTLAIAQNHATDTSPARDALDTTPSAAERALLAQCRVKEHADSVWPDELRSREVWQIRVSESPDIPKFTAILQKLAGVGYQRFGSEFAPIADWLEFYRDRAKRGYQEFDEQWPSNERTEACRELIEIARPSYKIDAAFARKLLARLPEAPQDVFGDQEKRAFDQSVQSIWGDQLRRVNHRPHALAFAKKNGLRRHEADILFSYSALAYRQINAALNNHDEQTLARMKPVTDTLDRALAKLPAQPGKVWRIVPSWPAAVDRLHKPGNVVTYPAYTSTSLLIGFVPPFMPQDYKYELTIQTLSGRSIEALAMDGYERELLIPRGKKFRVVSRAPTARGRVGITLQELP